MSETTKFLLARGATSRRTGSTCCPTCPASRCRRCTPHDWQPAGPDDLTPIFPMGLIVQEVSAEPEIEIPEEVREAYRLWRPTPLYRARRLERGARYAGAHLLQVRGRLAGRLAQAQHGGPAGLRERAGRASRSSSTETGAGQWGSSLAFACSLFGLECEVFMVGSSYDQKPYRRSMMETWGATVHRSPSRPHASPAAPQAAHPTGSLGIAISEAVEVAAQDAETQLRARLGAQPRAAAPDRDRPGGDRADGDGRRRARRGRSAASAAARTSPGSRSRSCARTARRRSTRFVAAEPAACPTLTRGVYRYDFGDTVGLTPLMPMYTLGHDFVPPPVHAGGLRYHGDAPMVCGLVQGGRGRGARVQAERDLRGGGAVRAHRGHHPGARAGARDPRGDRGGRARPSEAGEERVILFGLCGHGHFDLAAYDAYLAGTLEDPEFSEADMEAALARLPEAPAIALDVDHTGDRAGVRVVRRRLAGRRGERLHLGPGERPGPMKSCQMLAGTDPPTTCAKPSMCPAGSRRCG